MLAARSPASRPSRRNQDLPRYWCLRETQALLSSPRAGATGPGRPAKTLRRRGMTNPPDHGPSARRRRRRLPGRDRAATPDPPFVLYRSTPLRTCPQSWVRLAPDRLLRSGVHRRHQRRSPSASMSPDVADGEVNRCSSPQPVADLRVHGAAGRLRPQSRGSGRPVLPAHAGALRGAPAGLERQRHAGPLSASPMPTVTLAALSPRSAPRCAWRVSHRCRPRPGLSPVFGRIPLRTLVATIRHPVARTHRRHRPRQREPAHAGAGDLSRSQQRLLHLLVP